MMTDDEVEMLLERFDATDPKLQRRIIAELTVKAADGQAMNSELWKAAQGCPHCDYDEAEGALINHCDACCRTVTTKAWELLHK